MRGAGGAGTGGLWPRFFDSVHYSKMFDYGL